MTLSSRNILAGITSIAIAFMFFLALRGALPIVYTVDHMQWKEPVRILMGVVLGLILGIVVYQSSRVTGVNLQKLTGQGATTTFPLCVGPNCDSNLCTGTNPNTTIPCCEGPEIMATWTCPPTCTDGASCGTCMIMSACLTTNPACVPDPGCNISSSACASGFTWCQNSVSGGGTCCASAVPCDPNTGTCMTTSSAPSSACGGGQVWCQNSVSGGGSCCDPADACDPNTGACIPPSSASSAPCCPAGCTPS